MNWFLHIMQEFLLMNLILKGFLWCIRSKKVGLHSIWLLCLYPSLNLTLKQKHKEIHHAPWKHTREMCSRKDMKLMFEVERRIVISSTAQYQHGNMHHCSIGRWSGTDFCCCCYFPRHKNSLLGYTKYVFDDRTKIARTKFKRSI